MMEDNVSAGDTAVVLRLTIDSEKNSLEERRVEFYGASKDVISSYKRYSRARDKVAQKRTTRNLMCLEKSQTELGMYIDAYTAAKARVQNALDTVIKANDKYLEALYLAEDSGGAKRASRGMDSYVKRIERFVDKTDDSIACISSFYTLHIRESGGESDESKTQNLTYGVQNSAPTATYVHTNEVEVSPVSIDIGPTVERAIERAIAEFSNALEKRISELAATGEHNAAALSEAADKLTTTKAALTDLLADLDKIISDVGVLTDRCRQIADMQRSSTRELQGIEVKQRLVNQEQTELAEAQENMLERQRVLTEKLNRQTEKREEASNG